MGCSSSNLLATPNNPLQQLQYEDAKRERRKRKKQKEQKQIAKFQKKHAKRQKKKQKNSICPSDSHESSRPSGSFSHLQFTGHEANLDQDEIDRQIETTMQNQLENDLCLFLLNQITFLQQFYGNYERELTAISEEFLLKENGFNQNLEEHSILLASPLDAAVSRWLKFKPTHGPEKKHSQLLHAPIMYVIFENIDIARPHDANYDSISPLCKVDMQADFYKTTPCRDEYLELLKEIKWKGYVRLKLREDSKTQQPVVRMNNEDIYTDGSSGYSTTSGYSSKSVNVYSRYESETDYYYSYITKLNTHHPLSKLKMNNQSGKTQLNSKVLPESCVSFLGQFVEQNHDDETDEDENDSENESEENNSEDYQKSVGHNSGRNSVERCKFSYDDYETIQAIKMYKMEQERRRILLQQKFLNSREFMRYFGELFRQKLAHQLSISEEDLCASTYRASSIYTRRWEIIPAIHVPQNAQNWPDCAFQFRIRERTMCANANGQPFQWPTRAMIKRIESFGFHVVPSGYSPKRQANPFRELEWRVAFPKAERYLERHLTSAQVKVFMLTKVLLKTFAEPQEKNKALMFAIDLLRTHLFWECERNFTNWPNEFLGEVLIRFINSFMVRLREKCLPDYFIQERNLFDSIPEYSLVTLYAVLADITANPLMHLMVALRNLDHHEIFFPKLYFKKLFENLLKNDIVKLKALSKNARSLISLDTGKDEQLLMVDEGAKGLVGMKQHREKTNGKLRRKTHIMKHHIEMKKKQDMELRRTSIESIDVEFCFNRNLNNPQTKLINQGIENLRRTNILEILLDHIVTTIEKAIHFRSVNLAKAHVAQAKLFYKFYHNLGCDIGAKEYLTLINDLEENLNRVDQNDSYTQLTPALPLRSSSELSKNRPDVHHDTEGVAGQKSLRFLGNVEVINSEKSEDFKASSDFSERSKDSVNGDTHIHTVDVYHHSEPAPSHETLNCEIAMEIDEKSLPDEDSLESESNTGSEVMHSEKSFFSKFGTTAGILKSTILANSEILTAITASTEKALGGMSVEEKTSQFREMIKKKSVQLKGVFNQSSDL